LCAHGAKAQTIHCNCQLFEDNGNLQSHNKPNWRLIYLNAMKKIAQQKKPNCRLIYRNAKKTKLPSDLSQCKKAKSPSDLSDGNLGNLALRL